MISLRASVKAFSLVEVTLALGVAAFALLAIFGLLPVGISNNQSSIQQTAATNIATAIIADLKETPTAAQITTSGGVLTSVSPRYSINVTSPSTTIYLDDSGSLQPTAGSARYKAVITLTQPASGIRTATTGTIKIGWPAAAPVSLGSITVFVALDRN